ncbi:hypothetical protein G7Y89_g8302 [Cudoniella acicularis]|uniref:Uncharacterized protein n=1 Tax=Cudoniella acicularis TaxID=354080 RepID=A0A8H4W2Z6_9HELO|nr:hypothetical protein G7Y89_g8302 [Cudoniella acicularis]
MVQPTWLQPAVVTENEATTTNLHTRWGIPEEAKQDVNALLRFQLEHDTTKQCLEFITDKHSEDFIVVIRRDS